MIRQPGEIYPDSYTKDLCDLHKSLNFRCGLNHEASLTKLSENSPTGLALTLCLLRSNEKRTIEEVYRKDLKAAQFMIKHPDYAEGIRAQLVDKNKNPVWQPGAIDEISLPDFC